MRDDEQSSREPIVFGTAGVPHSSPKPDSASGVAHVRALGLDCMELAFVRSVRMGEAAAAAVKKVAAEQRVALSVHAPYYINLNSVESDKVLASRERILNAARVGWLCGATDVVFHPAYYHDDPPEIVYERVKGHLVELLGQLRGEGVEVRLRPETTGKGSQFGTLDEVLELSVEIDGVLPCVDFAHLHARSGADNSYEAFLNQLKAVEDRLGRPGLEDMHIHLSGIEYNDSGERNHLMLKDADLAYVELLQVLIDNGVRGRILSESPDMETDALLLQKTYRALRRGSSPR